MGFLLPHGRCRRGDGAALAIGSLWAYAPCPMTNRIAIALVLIIAAFFVADHFWLHLDAGAFLARKLLDLIDWVAFWR